MSILCECCNHLRFHNSGRCLAISFTDALRGPEPCSSQGQLDTTLKNAFHKLNLHRLDLNRSDLGLSQWRPQRSLWAGRKRLTSVEVENLCGLRWQICAPSSSPAHSPTAAVLPYRARCPTLRSKVPDSGSNSAPGTPHVLPGTASADIQLTVHHNRRPALIFWKKATVKKWL